MINATITVQNNSQLDIDVQEKNLLLGNNEFISGDVSPVGAALTLTVGEVMGRISATGKLTPCLHSASDGSEYPVGLAYLGVNETKVIADGATKTIELVNKGRIDKNLINFNATTTLDSVLDGRRISDWLNDIGLILVDSKELTGFAN